MKTPCGAVGRIFVYDRLPILQEPERNSTRAFSPEKEAAGGKEPAAARHQASRDKSVVHHSTFDPLSSCSHQEPTSTLAVAKK